MRAGVQMCRFAGIHVYTVIYLVLCVQVEAGEGAVELAGRGLAHRELLDHVEVVLLHLRLD